jgi:hypothetical protein
MCNYVFMIYACTSVTIVKGSFFREIFLQIWENMQKAPRSTLETTIYLPELNVFDLVTCYTKCFNPQGGI